MSEQDAERLAWLEDLVAKHRGDAEEVGVPLARYDAGLSVEDAQWLIGLAARLLGRAPTP